MSRKYLLSGVVLAASLSLAACGQKADETAADKIADAAATAKDAAAQGAAKLSDAATEGATKVAAVWPGSLKMVGKGFPNEGDPCRVIGESDATSNFLDDSATLVGCLSADDAGKLGGKVVATIEGVTLVSVPNAGN